jgi:HSP20 family protein
MANEPSSRDSSSRQQSAERAQPGVQTSQQGSGGARGGSASSTQAPPVAGTHGSQSASPWQASRGSSGGAVQRRGSSAMSPWSSGFESGGYFGGPFAMMRRISDEMARLFENFGMRRGVPGYDQLGFEGAQGTQNAPSMWTPHIEVTERDGKLLIQADLPGIKREDINVEIEQDAVVINGHRQQEQTSDQSGYYRSERSYGSFYRTIPLPEGTNADSASATFRDGVLRIELDAPRAAQRGRTLEVRDGNSQT